MYSGLQNGSASPGAFAGGGIATVIALPVTGVGPVATLSVMGNSLIISILLALSVICLVGGIRVLHRARTHAEPARLTVRRRHPAA